VVSHFGRMPKRGEQIRIDDMIVKVLRADSRRLHSLLIERVKEESEA
jgi:magnesium and cobalt transporter